MSRLRHLSLKQVVFRSVVFSAIIMTIVTIASSLLLGNIFGRVNRIENNQALLNTVITVLKPAIEISDYSEVQRLLGSISTEDKFLAVSIDGEDDLLSDYSKLPLVNEVLSKILQNSCRSDTIDAAEMEFRGKEYWVYCRSLEQPGKDPKVDLRTGRFGVVFSVEEAKAESFAIANALSVGVVIFLSMVVLAFVLSGLILNRVVKPVARLLSKVRLVSFKTIGDPSERLISSDDSNEVPREIADLERTYFEVLEKLWQEHAEKTEISQKVAVAEKAKEIVHDIRSPLSALSALIVNTKELSAEAFQIINSTLNRLKEISDSLLKETKLDSVNVRPYVKSLVEVVVREKRAQYASKCQLEVKLELVDQSVFGKCDAIEFKRILSNLIDNAIEARKTDRIRLGVEMKCDDQLITLKIRDDGKGISSELLQELGKRPVSMGKKDGHGIGLIQASKRIVSWGGSLEIKSEMGKGTEVIIQILRSEQPTWFVDDLYITKNSNVVVVDDEKEVLEAWRTRLNEFNVSLTTFSDVESFVNAQSRGLNAHLFIVDNYIKGSNKRGFEVVEELGIRHQSILFTSLVNDSALSQHCIETGLRLLPKDRFEKLRIHYV